MDIKEFAQSLELDHKSLYLMHRRGSSIHSFAYFFDVELERESKENLKWTLRKSASDFLDFQKQVLYFVVFIPSSPYLS